MALYLKTFAPPAGAASRVKQWACRRFGEGDEAWLVTETRCVIPGMPPRQTIVALIHPAASIAFRIPKPLAEVTEDDIGNLGEAAAALAAEGCC